MKTVKSLIPRLTKATKSREISWKESSFSSSHFITTLTKELSVVVGLSPSDEVYYIAILRDEVVVDDEYINEFESSFDELKELYLLVRRASRKVDEAISEIEDFLDNTIPF